jgi:RND family efflux transporter MFP subunit
MEVQRAMERIRAVDAAWESGVLPPSEYRRQQRDATTELAYLSADRGDVIALKCGLASAMEREERTRQSLEASVVRAPFPGVLANCTVETGAVVQAGTSLGTLIDARHLLLDADVLESEIGLVREGDSAVVEVPAIGPARFAGRVAHVNPVHESATRSALVTIQVALRGVHHSGRVAGPRPGMYGTARIIVDRLPGRILVPRNAVLFRSARNMVFLVRGNRSHWAYVDVGEESETTVAITRGVAPGDTVIVDGHFALGHDARVRIVADGGAE